MCEITGKIKNFGGKQDKMQRTKSSAEKTQRAKSSAEKTQRMSTVSDSMKTEVSKHYEAVVPKQDLMGQSWIGDPRAAARRKRIEQRQQTWLRVMAGFGLVLVFICSLIAVGAYFMVTARLKRTTGEEHNYFTSPFQLKTLNRICQVKYHDCGYESEHTSTICTQPQCIVATWVMAPIKNTTKMTFKVNLTNFYLNPSDSEGVHCGNGKYCSKGRCVEAYNTIYNKEAGKHEPGTWAPKPQPGNVLQWMCIEDSKGGRDFSMFNQFTECRKDTCEQSGSAGFQFKIYNRQCILEPDSQTAQRKRACAERFPHGVHICKICGSGYPPVSNIGYCQRTYPNSTAEDCVCVKNDQIEGHLPNGMKCEMKSARSTTALCLFGTCLMNESSPFVD